MSERPVAKADEPCPSWAHTWNHAYCVTCGFTRAEAEDHGRPVIKLTPDMLTAAWAEFRKTWRHVPIKVPEPSPGFKEAITAALVAGGYKVTT